METQQIRIELRFAWWFRLYLCGVILFAVIMRQRPDEQKLIYWIRKGLRHRVVPARRQHG
ncbi:hypothetical protein G5S34_17385 [Herbaspirillum frisingense]|uniref:hypothetical protein n=1 Tax=Herbaspirillum frisingense TaxID=92645 RepID=UPI001603D8FE|nr:hypothetical protein [Herbaspirillum frisingense]QNB08350.1 hypothetical protein G5S34_17385 [Herbaspirillum frisingense]